MFADITKYLERMGKIPAIIFVALCAFAFILLIFAVAEACSSLNQFLKNRITLETEYQKNRTTMHPRESYYNRIDGATLLLKTIDQLIITEVQQHLFTFSALRIAYPVGNLDNDVKAIAKSVYNGISKEFLIDADNIFTAEYIMSYINRMTMIHMIADSTSYNQELQAAKLTNQEEE